MKKILSTVLVCVLMVCMIFSLASCAKTLSGTYTDGLNITTYTFSGNKVTVSAPIVGEFEGTYSIAENEDGKLEITLDFGDEEDAGKYAGTFAFSEGEEDGKSYIKIGIAQYTKKN